MWMKAAGIVGEAFVLVTAGTVLLRLSGKKSISELTLASTVVMFMLGEILSAPLMSDSIWQTLLAIAASLTALIMLDLLQLKLRWMRRLLAGRPLELIVDGQIVETNMHKLRMSKEDLIMRLREQKTESIDDVQTATMETNGRVTVELKRHAKPVTVGELEKLLSSRFESMQPNALSSPSDCGGKEP